MIDDADNFKSEREERFGGKIRFLTYTRFLGKASSGKIINRGGILFVIGDTLYYEDFERSSALMGMLNQREKYTKTEFFIGLDQISIIKEIKEKNAALCINNMVDESEILPVSKGITSLFSKSVTQVFLKGQPSLFFDFLEKEGFVNLVNEFMLKPE